MCCGRGAGEGGGGVSGGVVAVLCLQLAERDKRQRCLSKGHKAVAQDALKATSKL